MVLLPITFLGWCLSLETKTIDHPEHTWLSNKSYFATGQNLCFRSVKITIIYKSNSICICTKKRYLCSILHYKDLKYAQSHAFFLLCGSILIYLHVVYYCLIFTIATHIEKYCHLLTASKPILVKASTSSSMPLYWTFCNPMALLNTFLCHCPFQKVKQWYPLQARLQWQDFYSSKSPLKILEKRIEHLFSASQKQRTGLITTLLAWVLSRVSQPSNHKWTTQEFF